MSATTTVTITTGEAATVEETRVRALFVSHLQGSAHVTPEAVRDAVTSAVRRHGSMGCAARVAQEYGEHPETAVARMRWALTQVRHAYGVAGD